MVHVLVGQVDGMLSQDMEENLRRLGIRGIDKSNTTLDNIPTQDHKGYTKGATALK
jgi:hypothetical protein